MRASTGVFPENEAKLPIVCGRAPGPDREIAETLEFF